MRPTTHSRLTQEQRRPPPTHGLGSTLLLTTFSPYGHPPASSHPLSNMGLAAVLIRPGGPGEYEWQALYGHHPAVSPRLPPSPPTTPRMLHSLQGILMPLAPQIRARPPTPTRRVKAMDQHPAGVQQAIVRRLAVTSSYSTRRAKLIGSAHFVGQSYASLYIDAC